MELQRWSLVCEVCSHEEPPDAAHWKCPVCGGAFALAGPNNLAETRLESGSSGLWRYSLVLPVNGSGFRTLGESTTPLVDGELAGRRIKFKLDSLLPTGSFKDRGAAVLVAYLLRRGVRRVIVDSSGNAAAALAGYSAANDMECVVYAPATTSPGKLVQARAYGATVHLIEGNREDVARAAQDAAASDAAAFYASHNWHAVFVEGVKTWALEVWEQLGQHNPAAAFVPTGGGSAFVGAYRGFAATGAALPRLVAAQPEACAPVHEAFQVGAEAVAPVSPGTTIAEGTRIGAPARGRQIMSALRESAGWTEAVSDDAIHSALVALARQGIYAEPTGAVGAAAFVQAVNRGHDLPDGEIVILITGSGLKATETISTLLG